MAMNAPLPTPVMTGLTWQEFLDLPEEYRHASLIDGELYVTAASFRHQLVLSRLHVALGIWINGAEGRGVVSGEPPVQITYNRGYLPDLAWWGQSKLAPPGGPPGVDGLPDLVAEVLSPSTWRIDTVRKRNDYPTVGINEQWLIDPDEPSAIVVRHGDGPETVRELFAEDALTSPQLPGFGITVGELVAW
jgi:Uma2 family endonuclease